MPILKFRIAWEEDEGLYRDIVIRPDQTFLQLHEAVLDSFGFDRKHLASFYRSNDHWQRGREILLAPDDEERPVPPLLMAETAIADIVRNPSQKFIYVYDFKKNWTFQVELIGVLREDLSRIEYPACVRKEGLAPSQYGTKGVVRDKMVETEEQFDPEEGKAEEGFGEEGEAFGQEGSGGEENGEEIL